MEIKLIKTEVNYLLKNEEGVIIASTSIKKGISSLSKQNCDSLFGVVDVESLALSKASHFGGTYRNPEGFSDEQVGYLHGFIEAMDLNKDKVFTLEDINNAMDWIMIQYFEFHEQPTGGRRERYLESIQQPSEIEVEIESKIAIDGHTILGYELDSEGYLILKKI
jgi:hypothetical protein